MGSLQPNHAPNLNSMKFTILFTGFIILFFSVSCDNPLPGEQADFEDPSTFKSLTIPDSSIEIAIIDGCEYVLYKEKETSNLGYGYMAHKGNCQNQVHKDRMILGKLDSLDAVDDKLLTNAKSPLP